MTSTPEQWRQQVGAAAVAGDQAALARLFTEAEALFGADRSARWAAALSGLDASAQTG